MKSQQSSEHIVILSGCLLLMAALACNAPGLADGSDSAATVGAVYGTITAQASMGIASEEATAPATSDADEAPTIEPSATVTLTPTPPETRTENGANITLERCPAALTVDGERTDWDALAADVSNLTLDANTFGEDAWTGLADLSGEALLCWTDAALYVLVEVMDDVHVQTQQGANQWQGDEVELMFDADLRGDFFAALWNDDDTQIGLSPGDFSDNPPSVFQYQPTRRALDSVGLMARRRIDTGGNYVLEARIPWETLTGGGVAAGDNFGLCLALSDNDQVGEAVQDSMVSHCLKLAVSDPTTWVTVTVEE